MAAIHVNGEAYSLGEDGHLKNAEQWNEAVAHALAAEEGITLTEGHWEVVHFLREYYDQYNIVPVKRLFQKSFADRYDAVKASDSYLHELFPGTVVLQASRIAGLPTPVLETLKERSDGGRLSAASAGAADDVGSLVESFEFEGNTYHLTHTGNLVEREAWSEAMAAYLAERQGIRLTDEHWEIIRFIRGFYEEYAVAPMVRLLVKHMRETLDEKKCNKDYLYQLFPGGPARQGSLIAGLAEPPGCID